MAIISPKKYKLILGELIMESARPEEAEKVISFI